MEVQAKSPDKVEKKLTFKEWMDSKKARGKLIFLDGSFSMQLRKDNHPGWTSYANFDFLDKVQGVYEKFINIGCDIITTNTYHHAVQSLMPMYGFDATNNAFRGAINAAHIARFAHKNEDKVRIILSIGSYATKLRDASEYTGAYGATVDPTLVRRYYWKQSVFATPLDYDGVIFETIPTKIDVEMIVDILDKSTLHDIIVSFSLDKLKLRDGTPVQEVVRLLLPFPQIIGVGINCSDPADGEDQIKAIVECGWIEAKKHIFIYPNAGETFEDGRYQGEKAPLHQYVKAWHKAGALAIGGCCQVGIPELVKIRDAIYEINGVKQPPIRFKPSPVTCHPPTWWIDKEKKIKAAYKKAKEERRKAREARLKAKQDMMYDDTSDTEDSMDSSDEKNDETEEDDIKME